MPLGGCKVTLGARCLQGPGGLAKGTLWELLRSASPCLGLLALEQFQLARSKSLLIVSTARRSRC